MLYPKRLQFGKINIADQWVLVIDSRIIDLKESNDLQQLANLSQFDPKPE